MHASLPATTFVVLTLMTGVVPPAAATPFSYSESVSGDLSSHHLRRPSSRSMSV